MPKGNKIEVEGVIVDVLPSTQFNIRITDKQFPENFMVRGYIAGKMRKNFIRIIAGDRVRLELDPYDMTKGRITFRFK